MGNDISDFDFDVAVACVFFTPDRLIKTCQVDRARWRERPRPCIHNHAWGMISQILMLMLQLLASFSHLTG
jgi:hypothetical protein